MTDPISALFSLSAAEKLRIVEELWDDIAASSENIPIHNWQLEELDRREAAYEADPTNTYSWDEVKKELRERYGR